MAKNTRNNTIFAKCCCLKQTLKENKHSSFRWFSEEHFTRLISKLEDVILARVTCIAPPEKSKKKNGKMSRCESHETLPDSELLINYQFVKRRKCRQTVLIRSKQELHGKYEGKNVKDSEYSGGGYQSLNFFPEKLKVTVGQISLDSLIMQSESGVTENKEGKPLKSVISKYFNKHDSGITHSTQKKKAALKNMNKKDDPQKKLDSLCTASSSINRFTLEQKGKKPSVSAEVEGESKQGNKQISWMTNLGDPQETSSRQEGLSSKGGKEKEEFTSKKEDKNDAGLKNLADEKFQLDDKADIRGSTALQGVLNSVEGNKECYKNKILVHTDDSWSEACGSANTGNAASCISERREKLQTAFDAEDATSKCNTIHQTFIVEEHSKSKTSGTKLKRPRSDSESDSVESDSLLPLRSRLSKKTTLKKRTAKTKGMRKESDSDCVTVGDENDFESPKVRRIVEKRQGSDLIDEHAQCSEQYNQNTTCSDVMKGLGTKKRKTDKVTGDTSYKRSGRPVKRKVNKRPLRTTSKTCDILEDLDEEPGSSPLEPITIEDKPPVALDVSTIEDLTLDQTEQLVWELASELREIFEGKRYCRRHEDYKRGGRMRGDLAFQVQFGQFTEEQRDVIMDVLTAMFCYKHSKYFDYVSKVLLPETLVMLYMKVVGRTRDEAELSLLERAK